MQPHITEHTTVSNTKKPKGKKNQQTTSANACTHEFDWIGFNLITIKKRMRARTRREQAITSPREIYAFYFILNTEGATE